MKTELSERAREARKEYMRRWRAENKERAAASLARQWEKYADKLDAEREREKQEGENSEKS